MEYLAPEGELRSVSTSLRHDQPTGAIIAGAGSLTFGDGTASSWRCGFDTDATAIDLKLSGRLGEIRMDNFVGETEDGAAGYWYSGAGTADADATRVRASEQTQVLLDAAWEAVASAELGPRSTSRPGVAQ